MAIKDQGGSVLEANATAGTRLEMLLFQLEQEQVFGINVFKVREVVPYRPLTRPAGLNPLVRGITTLRGTTLAVIDLSAAIGGAPIRQPERGFIIITEYNRSVHGFLIRRIERIVHTEWNRVRHLPPQLGTRSYVNAVALVEDALVEILDVEKVLDQVVHADTQVSDGLRAQGGRGTHRVLVVDDSQVARTQIQRAMEQLGVECTLLTDGREALDRLRQQLDQGVDVARYYTLMISDIEMPRMDGYELTAELRKEPRLRELYVLLHSSISGVFNTELVARTGANEFIQKYHPDDLARAVLARIATFDAAAG